MKVLFVSLFTLLLFRFEMIAQSENGFEIPIEQIAFDYFISKIDSIRICNGVKCFIFDTAKNRIYFSGVTAGGGGFNPGDLNKHKNGFIVFDSSNDEKPVRSVTGKRPLYSAKKFVVKAKNHSLEYKGTLQDISLQIPMRCFKNGFYYVCIWIHIGLDWISNDVYIKLDKNGLPIDYLQTWGIE